MNRPENLERDLTAWFIDTATPRVPDFTDDILRLTAGSRQRPRWSFPERWLPMSVITLGRQTVRPVPWRSVALIALLAVLLAAVAILVGSQSRLPAPFGVAANGLVAYSKAGDIFTVDPATGKRLQITSGDGVYERPLWSLNGTRLAFLRVVRPWDEQTGLASVHVLTIVDRAANVIAATEPIEGIDSDSVAWSPDSRSLALAAAPNMRPSVLYRVDAVDGGMTRLEIGYAGLDVYWRPAHEGQLLFRGGAGLVVADIDDPSSAALVVRSGPDHFVRPNGWTPDGRRIVYTRGEVGVGDEYKPGTIRLHVLDLETKQDISIEAGFGHVSNDGQRILALNASDRPCIASIDGDPCIQIGRGYQAYSGYHAAGAQWAPNDEWIVVLANGRALLLDPRGEISEQPTWVAEGAESWQRLAP